jgi:hypothetical protein
VPLCDGSISHHSPGGRRHPVTRRLVVG